MNERTTRRLSFFLLLRSVYTVKVYCSRLFFVFPVVSDKNVKTKIKIQNTYKDELTDRDLLAPYWLLAPDAIVLLHLCDMAARLLLTRVVNE